MLQLQDGQLPESRILEVYDAEWSYHWLDYRLIKHDACLLQLFVASLAVLHSAFEPLAMRLDLF